MVASVTAAGQQASRVAPLLDLDPDLGLTLDASRLEEARRALLVRVRHISAGAWETASIRIADPGHIGLLLLEGMMAREVLAADIVSTELLGPGELLRPWELSPDASLLEVTVRWSVLSDARVAVLDRRVATQLGSFPEVASLLFERASKRAGRLAVTQAISQLNRVDQRLLTLFWHLAERWGRMTPEGVLIPLSLSHRMLSQLVGARRPTVSTAIGELARQGQVRRRDKGTWLLTGRPAGAPAGDVRLVPPRRRFLPIGVDDEGEDGERLTALPAASVRTGPVRVSGGEELRERLLRARADCAQMTADLRALYLTTSELTRRTKALRERRLATRAPLKRPA
jgi:CRP/FNR family transcriptional regulator, cyclic AMP receptor protein